MTKHERFWSDCWYVQVNKCLMGVNIQGIFFSSQPMLHQSCIIACVLLLFLFLQHKRNTFTFFASHQQTPLASPTKRVVSNSDQPLLSEWGFCRYHINLSTVQKARPLMKLSKCAGKSVFTWHTVMLKDPFYYGAAIIQMNRVYGNL